MKTRKSHIRHDEEATVAAFFLVHFIRIERMETNGIFFIFSPSLETSFTSRVAMEYLLLIKKTAKIPHFTLLPIVFFSEINKSKYFDAVTMFATIMKSWKHDMTFHFMSLCLYAMPCFVVTQMMIIIITASFFFLSILLSLLQRCLRVKCSSKSWISHHHSS